MGNDDMQLAVFDLDGTLLNTLPDLAGAMNEVLGAHGFPAHPVEAYRFFVGDGVAELVRRSLPAGADESVVAAVLAEFKEAYDRRAMEQTCPYPGMTAALERIVVRGIRLAILTNKPDPITQELVRHYFPGIPFAEVLGAREDIPAKPDPRGLLRVMQLVALTEPSRAVMVGDSGVDMRVARAAGCRAIGVLWGFRPREELVEAGATALAKTPLDLPDLIRPENG